MHESGEAHRRTLAKARRGAVQLPAHPFAAPRRARPLRLDLHPLAAPVDLRRRASDAIKRAITAMDIYGSAEEIKLDEQQLCHDLGVSRTPIREALRSLEQEGLVRSVPRRGVFVVRKTKREIVEMITVWAAIESMAARLAAERASAGEFASLRALFAAFSDDPSAKLDEYSRANMAFHRALIRMSGCALMSELTDGLFLHMRAVRAVAMGQDDRARRSIADHRAIIDALERRDADLSERLVREHTLGLAAHIEKHGGVIDRVAPPREAAPSSHSRARPRGRTGEGNDVPGAAVSGVRQKGEERVIGKLRRQQ